MKWNCAHTVNDIAHHTIHPLSMASHNRLDALIAGELSRPELIIGMTVPDTVMHVQQYACRTCIVFAYYNPCIALSCFGFYVFNALLYFLIVCFSKVLFLCTACSPFDCSFFAFCFACSSLLQFVFLFVHFYTIACGLLPTPTIVVL